MSDTSRGRIYRLTPKEHPGYRVPSVDLTSDDGLAAALESPTLSTRSLANLKLTEKGTQALSLFNRVWKESLDRPWVHSRAVWCSARGSP